MSEPRQLRVVFVCTANIARSPYAERRAVSMLRDLPAFRFGSAGIPGHPGRPMDETMASVLGERGGASEGHISRSVDWWTTALADLVLTFEFAQHMRILDAFPNQAHKVLGLGQFADSAARLLPSNPEEQPSTLPDDPRERVLLAAAAAQPDSMTWDIADPYRRGISVARACADQIDEALGRMVPLFTGRPGR